MYNRNKMIIIVIFFLSSVMLGYAHQPHDQVRCVAVSPNYKNDRLVFCSLSHINSYVLRSEDGGINWLLSQTGLPHCWVSSICVSPDFADDNMVFISTDCGQIFRSSDGGKGWLASNHGLPGSRITTVAILKDFAFSKEIFCGTLKNGVVKSTDKGTSWFNSNNGLDNLDVLDIAVAYSINGEYTVFAGTEGGLYKTTDGGRYWFDTLKSKKKFVTAVEVSPNYSIDKTIFIGILGKGIYKSEDCGVEWTECNEGIEDFNISDLKISPNFESDNIIYVTSCEKGIYKTINAGLTWVPRNEGLDDKTNQTLIHYYCLEYSPDYVYDHTVFLASYEGLHKTENEYGDWQDLNIFHQEYVRSISISSSFTSDGTVYAGTYGGGIYRTTDLGDNWKPIDTGLSNLAIADIQTSPDYCVDKIVLAGNNRGVQASKIGGYNWKTIKVNTGDNIYIRSIAISPEYTIDKNVFVGNGSSGQYSIYKSEDGGLTYTQSFHDLSSTVNRIVISPAYKNDKILFASAGREGVLCTRNGGLSWDRVGLIGKKVFAIDISPTYDKDCTVFAGTLDSGVFRSKDGGFTWIRSSNGLLDETIEYLTFSPEFEEDRTIYAATKSQGLYRSTDAGDQWHYVNLIGEFIRVIKISPDYSEDETLFVGTWNGVYRSRDCGFTWEDVLNVARFDNHCDEIEYTGNWFTIMSSYCSGPCLSYSNDIGALCELEFVGNCVSWIGEKSPDGGVAEVYIDGLFVKDVDTYSSGIEWQKVLFKKSGLGEGTHSIRIVVTNTKNRKSLGNDVYVDAVQVEK